MRLKVCVRLVVNGDLRGCSWNSTDVRHGYTSTPVLLGDWLRTRLIPRVSTARRLPCPGPLPDGIWALCKRCRVPVMSWGYIHIRVRIDGAATHQHDDVSLSSDLQGNLRLFVTAGQTAAATGRLVDGRRSVKCCGSTYNSPTTTTSCHLNDTGAPWKTRRPRAREGQLHLELGPHKPRSVRNACPSVNLDRQPRPVHTDVCVGGMVFRLCVVTCSVCRMPKSVSAFPFRLSVVAKRLKEKLFALTAMTAPEKEAFLPFAGCKKRIRR